MRVFPTLIVKEFTMSYKQKGGLERDVFGKGKYVNSNGILEQAQC